MATPSASEKREGRLVVAALFAFTAALAFRNVTDVDFGIHAAGGRWILENGRVPTLDPFTYTVGENAYLAYHWLHQVVFYAIFSATGVAGTVLFRFAVLIATALLVADVVRLRGCQPAGVAVVGFATLVVFEWSIDMSPQLATVLLSAATLWLLERHRMGERAPLWLLPVIQIVWINTHLFVLGFAIMGIYVASDAISRRTLRTPLAGWTAACVPALLVNPYGVDAIVHPLLLATRLGSDNPFANYIIELKPPWVAFPDAGLDLTYALYLGLLAIGAVGCVSQLRRRRFEDAAILAVFGALSLSATRNVPLYALIAMPALCSAFDDLFARLPAWASWQRSRSAIAWAMICVLAITTLRVLSGAYYQAQNAPVRFGASFCNDCLSLDAADWLATHPGIEGPGFNQLNLGSTLIWRDPARKVFIDGRNEVTGEAFLGVYLQAQHPATWPAIDDRYGFQYAVLAHNEGHVLLEALWRDPSWRSVYLDAASSIFVRDPGANAQLQGSRLPLPVDDAERDEALAAAEPRLSLGDRAARWLVGRDDRADAPRELGAVLLAVGEVEAAERPLLEAAQLDPGNERVHRHLTKLYEERNELRAAVQSQLRAERIAESGVGF